MSTSTEADRLARPGNDTRRWSGVGIVEPDSGDQHAVSFTDAQGNPSEFGVQVQVKMVPGGDVLPCRVSGALAGNGEGEYHPFVSGDEVVVLIPDGDEKNGGIIVGRLNQSLDVLPSAVAGQDVTQNTIAFKRVLAPYIIESGTSLIARNAATGAALTLDPTGNAYLSSGSGAMLTLRSDVVALSTKAEGAFLQLDPDADQATLGAASGDVTLLLAAAGSQFQSSGSIQFSTGGNGGVNHVTTTEAVGAILQAYNVTITAALTAIGAAPLTGASLAAVFTAMNVGGLAAAFALAAKTPPVPALAGAIVAAMTSPKVALQPGIGSPGVMVD